MGNVINIDDFIKEISQDKLLQKYITKYNYLSGCNTIVYSISLWKSSNKQQVIIQIMTTKNIFNKIIKRYMNKYKNIKNGYFYKNDNSCPNELIFEF